MNETLRTIVAEAYDLFPSHRFGARLHNVCTGCCVTAEEQALLIGTPRQAIPVPLMQAYYGAAFNGCLSAEETEHFLPRLLELSAEGYQLGTGGFECNFNHLGTRGADYRHNWSREKTALIDRYFLALAEFSWQAGLPNPQWQCHAIEDVLCAIAQGSARLPPILSAWQADQSRQATIRLANTISNLHWSRRKVGFAKLTNAFWADVPDQEYLCVAWLCSPGHYTRFDTTMNQEEDDEVFALLSLARDVVSAPP